ncbi:MAG: AzlD domain-containing protein [candidate division NC10 bacterium]|jgi:branched-subunit amino acid transport protein|nr:AzlD domain-containing protein [candidate division NC10 bacterium]MCZ6549926.1 AzlD domain-containing protein [candidate division NC10 bacterium]
MVEERIAIILGMGLVTYMLRVFPLLLAHRLPLPPRIIRWFQFLSYSIISSFVWFGFVKGASSLGTVGFRGIALALTILVAVRARNALAGMAAGIAAVLILSRVGL